MEYPAMIRSARLRTLMPCLVLALALAGCASLNPWNGSDSALDKHQDLSKLPAEQLYSAGIDALRAKQYNNAVKLFDAVEQNYPYSSWATHAELMHGYADYLQNHYTPAIGALDRYIQLHPANNDIAYAYYLRALCYYEQISDIQRDQKETRLAMAALQEVVNRFPDSAYAQDAKLKIDLCNDHLAGKEMAIGRWYQGQHLYEAAIGRFQRVVQDFQTTNHVPEALHRLTEIYLKLGMISEAKKTAAILGYNYPGSRWYEDSWNQLIDDKLIRGKPVGEADNGPGFLSRTLNWIF